MLDKNLQSSEWSFEIKTDKKPSSVIFAPPGAFFWDIPPIQSDNTIFSQLNPPLVQFNPENLIHFLSKSSHSFLWFFAPSFQRKKRKIFQDKLEESKGEK